jgi:hypothetical protein
VDEESAELRITFGSSYQTSDGIVDVLAAKWDALDAQEKAATHLIQIKMDNGPEGSGRRTQFLHRMVQLADYMNSVAERSFTLGDGAEMFVKPMAQPILRRSR